MKNWDNPWAKKTGGDIEAPIAQSMNRGDGGGGVVPVGEEVLETAEPKFKPKREKRVFGAKKKLTKVSEQEQI